MFALVNTSARLIRTPDGHLWSPDQVLAYPFWTRYLDVYEGIRLLVRSTLRPAPPEGWHKTTGPRVEGIPLDDFHSPLELAQKLYQLQDTARRELKKPVAIHLRGPCMVGEFLFHLLPSDRPYGIEVCGTPLDMFPQASLRRPDALFYRTWFATQLKRQCSHAAAAAYVTREALQKVYPPHPNAFSTHYSSIILKEEAFALAPRSWDAKPSPLTLVSVCSLEQPYKGIHILLDAFALAVKKNPALRLLVVGGGRLLPELQGQAARLGIASLVDFVGQAQSASDVRSFLQRADLFVMPSLQEGLPKAMIEAMAQALPCIGTDVGGIPELLAPSLFVPAGQAEPFAKKILDLAANPGLLTRLSAENLQKARDYHHDILKKRRDLFYTTIKEKTEAWLQTSPRSFVFLGL